MERIYRTIEKYHMIGEGDRVIAGVSGGADSVCMLLALSRCRERMPFSLEAVYVEHGIRGQESLEDGEFVRELCGRFGIPFRLERVHAREEAARRRQSVEEAGRALRYGVFEEIRQERDAQRIAVAHNRGDQAETVLWNLARGTGLKGLAGIRPVSGAVIRPLLFLTREEIEGILKAEGFAWRTDSTNLETDYTRNRIRLRLLPEMERDLNPQAVRHISDAALRLREVQDYLEEETDRAEKRCVTVDLDAKNYFANNTCQVVLSLPEFRACPPLLQKELLKRCIVRCRGGEGLKDVGSVHLEALAALCEKDCGKECRLPGGIRVLREEGALRFCAGEEAPVPAFRVLKGERAEQGGDGRERLPLRPPLEFLWGSLRIRAEVLAAPPGLLGEVLREKEASRQGRSPGKKKNLCEKTYTKWLSCDTISRNACFRTRRPGDFLVVNAQGGSRKLKDYLIGEKIPKDRRDRFLVLAEGSHVLWAESGRISEGAKIREDTAFVLKIQVEEEETP